MHRPTAGPRVLRRDNLRTPMPFPKLLLQRHRWTVRHDRHVRSDSFTWRWHGGDCKLLHWDGIKNAVAGAADMNAAFDAFCLDNGVFKPECRGLGSGCLSAAEIEAGVSELF